MATGRKTRACIHIYIYCLTRGEKDFTTLEDWTDKLSRNLGTALPFHAA